MVDKNVTEKLQKNYSDQIQNLNQEREEQFGRRSVEMFFSFDIVNSTAYKTLNFTGWSQVIIVLFSKIQQSVAKKMPSAEMWRILGDEVIFIVPIREKEDIFVYTSSIFEILNNIVFQLKKGKFFDELGLCDIERDLMKMQNIISLKASAWIAIIGEGLEKLEQYDNLIKRFKLQEGYGIFEFLGNDIDTGFRIKENSQDRRLVISYELAYILSRNTDYLKNLHIVTYKRLKGVWQNRLYPIIWYHDDKYLDGVSFENSFYYDEKENSELVKLYFKNRVDPVLEQKMYFDVVYALNKIMTDQKLEDKFIKMDKLIKESQQDVKHLLDPKFLLRLHCVSVCYDKSKTKILIMKRANNREKFPGYWEFGCAKGTLETSLAEQIEEEYRKDFGINIKVQCNNDRKDVQPIPLAMYEIDTEQGKDKGIITMAEIIEDFDINNFSGDKHSEVRWIRESEIEQFSENTVEDFENTLKIVFNKLREKE